MFVANYYRTTESGYVTFVNPLTKVETKIPHASELTLPGLSGILIPVGVPIQGSSARIMFSTSQVISAFERSGSIYMELHGYPNSAAEVAIALKNNPRQAFVDGKKAEFSFKGGEAVISFRHSDEGSVLLKLNLRER